MSLDLPRSQFVNKVVTLPSMSGASSRILQVINDESAHLQTLSECIELDPILSGRLLKVANSPFFGMDRRIGVVEEAVTVLGLSSTRSLVMSVLIIEQFKAPELAVMNLDDFWRHALCTACSAQVIAALTPVSPMQAFTAGLMHDLGRLVLTMQQPKEYEKVKEKWRQTGEHLYLVEQEILGVDHTVVGADLMTQWRLPVEMTEAVANHHQTEESLTPLTCVLAIADRIGAAIQKNKYDNMASIPLKALSNLNLQLLDIQPWFEPIERRYETLCELVIHH